MKLLFELASLIDQNGNYPPFTNIPFILQVENVDWPAVVLEMFSRKLDKLFFRNRPFKNFLSNDQANAIIKVFYFKTLRSNTFVVQEAYHRLSLYFIRKTN